MTVHPAEKNVTLYISETGRLQICAQVHGAKYIAGMSQNKGFIEGADIIVKGKNTAGGGGLHTQKTLDGGYVFFKDLAFGDYEITVIPPASFGAIPPQKTVSTTIDTPLKKVTVLFDSSSLFKISGKVLEAETRQPVEGYVLELGAIPFHDFFSFQGLGVTDADGSFEITNISDGQYFLRTRAATFKHFDYVPPEYLIEPRDNETKDGVNKFGMAIEVNGADVTGIEYLVHKSKETRFIGRVVDPGGRPVGGVRIKFNRGKGFRLLPQVTNKGERPTYTDKYDYGGKTTIVEGGEEIVHSGQTKSNADGTFTMAIQSFPYSQICRGTLHAQYDLDNDYVSEREGKLDVEFHPGDTLENLEIVLSVGKDDYSTIMGEILSEDGDPLYSVFVTATHMDGYTKLINKTKENHYRIDWVKPGKVEIIGHPQDSFCDKFFHIDVPEKASVITCNLVFERGAKITGKVIDRNYGPVAAANVIAFGTPSYYHGAITDEDGRFEMKQACPEMTYDLDVYLFGPKEGWEDRIDLGWLPGIRPPAKDVTIMVTPPE